MTLMHRALVLLAVGLAATSALAQAPQGKLYTPGPFDQIDVDGAARVTLTQGDRDQVFIHGDAAMQTSADVVLVGKRLRIDPAGGWKFWNNAKVQVDVQMRDVSRITLSGATDLHAPGPIKSDRLALRISGAGSARFDALDAGQLRFDISGAGNGQLAGRVDELGVRVSGKGKLAAEELRAAHANVSISGVGNASLWVTDKLQVNISGVGNVEYWGQPEVIRSTSGLGSVEGRGDKH